VSSLEFIKHVLCIVEHLGFDKYLLAFNLLDYRQQVLLHLFSNCLLQLSLNLLAVLQPLKSLVSLLNDLVIDKVLSSLVDSCLERWQIDLLLGQQVNQSLLLLLSQSNHLTVLVTLVHIL